MKRIIIVLVLLLIIIKQNQIFAAKVDDIINKHIDAHGGVDNWNKIKTMEITGTFTGFSIPSGFKIVRQRPNLYRNDYGLSKFDVTEVYKGETGWTIDPWFDIDFPRYLNAVEENVMQQKAEFCTPFFNYKNAGHKVEFIGEEELEGLKVLKLKLTRKSGNVETWYLDAETYLEIKQESVWADFGFPQMQETFFDDFRTVEGVVLPFFIDRSYGIRNRVFELENVKINPIIDRAVFEMPLSAAMHKLKIMAGEWSVLVETRSRMGWRRVDSTSSVINFLNGCNLLQANIEYDNYFHNNNFISWSYNSNKQAYLMSVFNGFSSNCMLFLGNFTSDSLIFDNVNVNIGSEELETKMFRKFILSGFSENSFLMERASSSDKGKTWMVHDKFYFTRLDQN